MKLQKLFLNPIVLLLLIGLLAATTIYSYLQYQSANNQLGQVQVQLEELRKNSGSSTGSEIKVLVDKVGRLVALPQGETPNVATITDVEKLREQPFFANADNGDKVLIYSTARKAYLYRPSENKIIEVAPINITQKQTPPANVNEQPADNNQDSQDTQNQPSTVEEQTNVETPTTAPTTSPESTPSSNTAQ